MFYLVYNRGVFDGVYTTAAFTMADLGTIEVVRVAELPRWCTGVWTYTNGGFELLTF